MSATSHVLAEDGIEIAEGARDAMPLPAILLVAGVLLVGVLAAITGNLDMGAASAPLLIGP
ncbi:MAG: hypothetical protein ACLQJR_04075 [Stellaceae bacterium]